MKKVLVTGGAGFIGSHTCVELINEGYIPVIVDNFANSERWVIDRIEQITGVRPILYEGDCRNEEFLANVFSREGEIYGVIHFAALKAVGESVLHPLEYYDNNIRSLTVLLSAMKKAGIKHLVFSSSATVYGVPKINPIPEESEIKEASSPYGATKIIAERMLRDLAKSGADMATVALRYFNPIGAHPSGLLGEIPLGTPNNLVPYITQVAAGKMEKLTVFGNDYQTQDGTCIRDFIHVMDLARAHIATLEYIESQQRPYFDAFNVGTGCGTSVKELIQIFNGIIGFELPHEYGGRREGDIAECYATNSKITKAMKWKAEFTVEDALRDAWKWQQNQQNLESNHPNT